jgi:glycosyltransferase involved in cell wall biosynthesis
MREPSTSSKQAARSLIVLDAAYSLSTVRRLSIEHSVLHRDLGGYFDHVWNVHPFVGADLVNDDARNGPLRVTLLAPRHSIVEAQVGRFTWLRRIPLLNFALSQFGLLLYLLRLRRRERVVAIRVGDPYYLGLVGLLVSRIGRIPLVIRINGDYDAIYHSIGRLAYPRLFRRRWVEKKIDRFVLPRADLVMAANAKALEYGLANGARRDRAAVVRYGSLIDPIHFGDPASRPSIRHELQLGEHPFIVCVSRLEAVKHPGDVIRALAIAKRAVPDLCAVFIGDGSEEDDLRKLAEDLDLESSVRFVGTRPQAWIASCLSEASAVAAPMAGRALVESLLSGAPVVAYDVDWHAEMIQNGTNGVLVPYEDADALGRALSKIVTSTEGAQVGERGRASAIHMMDPEKIAMHERELYESLLGRVLNAPV